MVVDSLYYIKNKDTQSLPFTWGERWGSVTFCDPETSRLATSCHRKISLRIATGNPHPRPLDGRGFENNNHSQVKYGHK